MKSNPLMDIFYDSIDVSNERVKDFEVRATTIQVVKHFIERWHYSENVNGLCISHVFGLYFNNELIGAMIYGKIAMANAWKKYADSEEDIIELRRLCCIDKTPKNTESYFIGKTLKWLKRNTKYKIVISYADSHHNHVGTIYKASNFNYLGMTSKGRIISYNGKIYHDKCIRTYHIDKNGNKKLKPFAKNVKNALETGEAEYINTPGKHIYVYPLVK